MSETKICSGCLKEKPVSEFSPRSNKGRKYLMSACKTCIASQQLKRYHEYTKFSSKEIENRKKRAKERWRKLKEKVFVFLGGKCCRCGFSDFRALQIDHVNGKGLTDRNKYKGYFGFYNHVLEVNGEGYQLLCANCNWIKRVENNECSKS